MDQDSSLDLLLDLDGQVLVIDPDGGHWVRFVVTRVPASKERPHGLDYSLTLHDRNGERIVSFDNAHPVRRSAGPGGKGKDVRDHRHRLKTIRPYEYQDAATLVADFWFHPAVQRQVTLPQTPRSPLKGTRQMIRKTRALAAFAAALATSAVGANHSRSGQFTGASNHVTSGGVTITQDASGTIVQLGPQFFLDGAPDPKVGFGINGQYVEGTLIGALQSTTGAQTYRVPAHLNVADFNNVFIWCERFSVPLGVATLN